MLTLTFPAKTWAHSLPAGGKLAALSAVTLGLFALSAPAHLALAALAMGVITLSCGAVFARASLRALWMLWPFALIVALWHIWLGDAAGIAIILRMITAVAAANFVTMTTRLSDMIAVLEWLTRPLARIIPPQRLALAIALTIRFIPVMLLRADDLSLAWRARSAKPARARILPALALSALDDASRVADALAARGGVS